MTQLDIGPVVGQIGGRVESVPVSITEVTGSGVDHVLAEVDAGDGALVSLTADVTQASSNANARLVIGDSTVQIIGVGGAGVAAHASGPTPIILHTTSASSGLRVSLTGTVHTIPHPLT